MNGVAIRFCSVSKYSLCGVCGAMERPGFMASLVAGGIAGVSVDLILYPLDTIKTRLQSPQGFNKAGGFRGIYAGVPSAAIGSFPNAAAFFITYEYVKWFLHTDSSSYLMPVKHMLAASAGEVVACLIRVPSEVVKQRAQVSSSSRTFQIFSNVLYQEGIRGLYRGYTSTVLREALWSWRQDHVVDCWQSAVCGAFAGGFAAVVTTPLDVAKTRIMLAKVGSSTASGNVLSALHGVWRTQGLAGAGVYLLSCDPAAPEFRQRMSVASLPFRGPGKIICRCLPSNGSHQSGRLHLSWCL
ncbi:S-adenosylmethionine mitochondrial carrier protein isoform X2 [Panthera leo]|uniref:S-adenosylmethionine mitochondrial carrier protein isoform X2 n=1 Tax=Panthera leo TaxID=9689 RepID=UPI001C69A838|nr:S-adenosylmethionine mitochondrial carrier protein isoform X2 [Panthera leo]